MTIIDQTTYIGSPGAAVILGLLVLICIASLFYAGISIYVGDTKQKVKGVVILIIGIVCVIMFNFVHDTAEKETSYEVLVTDYAEVDKQGYKIISHVKNDVYTVKKETN